MVIIQTQPTTSEKQISSKVTSTKKLNSTKFKTELQYEMHSKSVFWTKYLRLPILPEPEMSEMLTNIFISIQNLQGVTKTRIN